MAEVGNWQELSRAIVRLIRDQFGVAESSLTRGALLESDLGLTPEQLESLLAYIEESFGLRFPPGTLDEVLRLEDLTLLACWLKGFYKRPSFLSDSCAERCRTLNPGLT